MSCLWRWINWETLLGFQWELNSCEQFSPHVSKALDSQMNSTLLFLTLHLLWSVVTGYFYGSSTANGLHTLWQFCVKRLPHQSTFDPTWTTEWRICVKATLSIFSPSPSSICMTSKYFRALYQFFIRYSLCVCVCVYTHLRKTPVTGSRWPSCITGKN